MKYIEIGQITSSHGVKGHVKVTPFTDYPERFKTMKDVLLQRLDGSMETSVIEETKYHKNIIILKLKGIDSVESVQRVKGVKLVVKREDLVKLPQDSYYIFDLVGCAVYEEEELLGTVKDVISTGSNDVYVIERVYNSSIKSANRDLLIPALGWVILDVDIAHKKIEVKLPEGLREL